MADRPDTTTVPVLVETEMYVEVDAESLEQAGWVWAGPRTDPDSRTATEIVRDWHDSAHAGPWKWCTTSPCKELIAGDHK